MTDLKATPGPWEVRVSPRYAGLSYREIADENGVLGEVYSGTEADEPTDEEAEANAHLIAASPELYEAAELALDLLECIQEEEGFSPSVSIPAHALRTALAKARGEQSPHPTNRSPSGQGGM